MGTFRMTTHHLLGPRYRKQRDFFLYYRLLDVKHDCHLVHFFQVRGFVFLPRTTDDHSHVASIQRKLVASAYVLPAAPASPPSPNANGGIDLQVFGALDCLTLQPLQVDQMRKEESKEF